MKRNIILLLLAFVVLDALANANNFSANDSACIIEGTIKNIPDGCDVILYGSAGKYSGNQKTITQIKKGKFHFEKKVKGDEKYEVFLFPCIESLTLFVSPGTKTIITGNGTHPSTWNAKSDNPLQKEWNALQKLERDSIPEYLSTQLRLNDIEAELYGNPKESKKENLLKEKDELIKKKDELSARYVEVMCNFIKGSTYSDVLESKLRNIAERTSFVEKKEKLWEEPFSNILREFLEKAPQECLQSPNIVYAKKLIGMPKDYFPTAKPESQSVKTLVAPANGNGWCTFYDAEKSYETDDLAEIYVIKRKETDGTYELTNMTENIIPAGVPVILHLGRSMEDGTNYSFLKEVNSDNTPGDFREWNFLDMTSAGEKVMGWRIGFSSDENKVALYPWETDDAEAGVIYFRKLNSYIPGFSVTNTLSKWDIDNKKRIGGTQRFSRNLQQKPLTSKGEISYCINADFSNNAIKTYALRGTNVEIDSTDIERFPEFLMGDKLIVANAYGRRNYHVGLWKNNRLEKTELLFTVGDGPNDYIRLRFAKGNNNSLLALDGRFFPPFSMTVIPDVKSIEDLKDTSRWKKYDLKDMKELFIQGSQYCSLSDSTILVSGTTKEYFGHILSIIDYKNHKCIPLDFWPDDGMEIDSLVKCRVYTGNSVVRGNGKGRYLFHLYEWRYSFIFTIDGNKVNVVKELYTKYPEYSTKNHMDPIWVKFPERVTSAVNDKYVFILPIDSDKEGKKLSSEEYYRTGQTLNGNTVEMYDWNGNLLRKLKLDNFGHSLMLSDDGNTLYLSNDDYWDDLDPKIWSYDISNLDALPVVDDSEEFTASVPLSTKGIIIETPKKIKGVVEEGDMMADFELYDYDDKPHHLNEFVGKGKYTILEFSSLGCGPCQMAKPALEEFYKENKDKFEMITISTDREKAWKKKPLGEVSWHEWNDHALAEEIMKKYHVVGVPTFIIINPDGKVEKKCVALFNFFEALKNYIPAEKLDEYMKKME